VITASTTTVPDEPEFIGQAEASRPVEIRSQVTGLIKAVLYQEGRDVKKGDRLYQIDPVPFQAAAASAKAKIAQAEAKVVQAKQDLARVKPLLEKQDLNGLHDLLKKSYTHAQLTRIAGPRTDHPVKALVSLEPDQCDPGHRAPRYYEGRLVSAQTDLLTMVHRVDPMYVVVSIPETFI
jgi:membrane fusion protein (multidrug efflux system)